MATTALKEPKTEQGEADTEANSSSTQIPNDKEALLDYMDQRANSIQRLKDQISSFERKLDEERKLLADAEAKFIQVDKAENATSSKTKPKAPESLLGISEFWTKAKPANGTSSTTPHPRSEMESETSTPHNTRSEMESQTSTSHTRSETRSSKLPSIILPPSFKRRAPASVRPEVSETSRAEPMATRDYNIPTEVRSAPDAKRSRTIPNEVVRETQVQDRDNYTSKDFAKPRIRVSPNNSGQPQQEKTEFQGHDELIAIIGRSSLRATIQNRTVAMIPSGHTKRMRSLALSPSNRELFATSALDGVVHFWKLHSDRSTATLFKTVNRITVDQKKWAEDIAWHPHKSALFSVYTADDGHPQISAAYLNEARESCESKFMKDRPHSKGLINRIMFTPWDDPCFITGGCDHAVVLWREQSKNDEWKSTLLHKDFHSSAVMGVAGMRHNNLVLSCGDDRRFVGYDAREEKLTFRHRLDNRCTSLLPNPRDVNLVMVHTRQLDRQLRLYDVRLPQTELFSFGWKQESSESQSALINQSWSPDGLHISSGSADPVIHIFDIRYNAPSPSLSIKAHKKRVFKAEWHSSLQLLVSISSDLEIGIHKICRRRWLTLAYSIRKSPPLLQSIRCVKLRLSSSMASPEEMDATSEIPSPPKNTYKDPDDGRQRFLLELEFVQCLANPTYIHHLAQNRYFEDEAFIGYLKYLQYWQRPEYIKFIMYPHCLYFLELLQNPNFRAAMAHPANKELAHRQQFYYWKNYRNNRLKHILPRPLPEPVAPPPPPAAPSAPLPLAPSAAAALSPALSPMQYSNMLPKNEPRNMGPAGIDRRKRKKGP
ncbi:unnamed protein product [Microthlaspi erraticum]|uniref:Mediator of RNA polymerase II transcription subunit 31 n=1 Tax=Microthlaspi erraticum TaxID=1685480 RepID=A0A6D2L2R6_9BRAS|nr:unnamed protein product [Microthlaspi erraticum]